MPSTVGHVINTLRTQQLSPQPHSCPPAAPCGHVMMCMECAEPVHEKNGGRCEVCEQPSELKPASVATITCMVCSEEWASGAMFIPGECGHAFCIGCTTTNAREALGDRSRVTGEGIPCVRGGGCPTRVGVAIIRQLKRVGSQWLPDPRAMHGDPEVPIEPLSQDEEDLIGRFMVRPIGHIPLLTTNDQRPTYNARPSPQHATVPLAPTPTPTPTPTHAALTI